MTTAIKYIILILIQLQYLVIPITSHISQMLLNISLAAQVIYKLFFLPRLSNMAHNLTIVWLIFSTGKGLRKNKELFTNKKQIPSLN